MRSLIVLFALALVLVQSAQALPIDAYKLMFHVVGNTAVASASLELPQATTDILRIPLPADAKGIDLYVDGEKHEPVIETNKLIIRLKENRKIEYSFASKKYIDSTNFVYNLAVSDAIAALNVKLALPEGAILKDAVANSVFPEPDELTSDGRSIILIWHRQNLKEGDEISIFTRYQVRKDYGFLILPSVAAVLVALGLLYYVLLTKKAPKKTAIPRAARQATKKHAEEYDVMKHFKEEEQQIIRVLKQRDGSCEQGTLRVITGFSKATLSRLLSELEERKIVYKEKRGKKNLVFLKEY